MSLICSRFRSYSMIILIIIITFSCLQSAYAEDRVLTLSEAYIEALKTHESVKIAKERLYQFEQGRKKALSSILPSLTADAGYTKYSTEKSSTLTVIQPDYSYNFNIRLGVPLYRGGREWSALRQAKHMLEAGEKGLAISQESIIMDVSIAYYRVLKVKRDIDIKEADLKRAEERTRVASARFKVGDVTKTAVLRAEAEMAGIQAELARARMDLLYAHDNLARIVNISPDFKLDEPPPRSLPKEDIDKITEIALEKRDDYLKLMAEEEVAKEGIRYARGGYMPSVNLDGIYSWHDQDPVSTAFFNKESIFATLSITFPLYEGGLRVAEVREAESKLREAELNRLYLRKQIELEVREGFYNLQAINSSIEFYIKQVSFAEENYNTVFKQFSYGLATNVDVIDANSTLVEAQESLANSTIDLQLAILDLKRRAGILISVIDEN